MNPTRAYDDHIATAIEQRDKKLSEAKMSISSTPTTIQEVLEESLQQQEMLTKLLRQLQDRLGPVMNDPEMPIQEGSTPPAKGHSMMVNGIRHGIETTRFQSELVSTLINALEL